MGYLSYQNPWFILTAQAFWAKGNQAGNWTTVPNNPGNPIGQRADSLWTRGYSVFGDVKVPVAIAIPFWKGDHKYPLHVFTRYDWFDADTQHVIAENATYTKLIAGVAYYLYKNNLIIWTMKEPGTARIMAPGSPAPAASAAPVITAPLPGWLTSPAINGNLGMDQRLPGGLSDQLLISQRKPGDHLTSD